MAECVHLFAGRVCTYCGYRLLPCAASALPPPSEPTFSDLLNDPMQQLDSDGEVLRAVIQHDGFRSRYGPTFNSHEDRDQYDRDEASRRYESESRWWDERNAERERGDGMSDETPGTGEHA